MPKRKSPWSKTQLVTLYECWKDSNSRQECLILVSKKLPEMPPPVAWALIRRLSRTDRDWQVTARQKERQKEERKLVKERARQERVRKRSERQQEKEWKGQREALRTTLNKSHVRKVAKEIGSDFFFCPDTHQFVSRLSCIFRVFSNAVETVCDKKCSDCDRMDSYIPTIERIIT